MASWNEPSRPGADPVFARLRASLSAAHLRLEQERMAAQKAGQFPDDQLSRHYGGLLEDLSSSFTVAGRDRMTMLCLFEAKR